MKRGSLRLKRYFLILIILAGVFATGYFVTRNSDSAKAKAALAPSTPEARNAVREKSLEALAAAIRTSTQAHNGKYPFLVPHSETGICNGSTLHCKQAHLVDLSQVISDGAIASIPNDPSGGAGEYNSGFSLRREADGSIYLIATRTEGAKNLSVRI